MTAVDDLAVHGFLRVAERDPKCGSIVVKEFTADARRWRVDLVPQLFDQCLVTVTELRCYDSGRWDLNLHRRHEHIESCHLMPDDGWNRGYTYKTVTAAAAAALAWDPETEGEPYGWHRAVAQGAVTRRRPDGDVNRESYGDSE